MGIHHGRSEDVKTLSVDRPEEAPSLVGQAFVSPWFSMDNERTELFERSTYQDLFPHPYTALDAYGDNLVEGFHLLGMIDFLMNQVLWSEGRWMAWNYGLDSVRFVTPVRTTDRIRLRGEVAEVIDRGPQGHLLVLPLVGEVEGREKPGFVATQRMLWSSGTTQ